MAYKVLDIFKDLPGTNCGDCGRVGCFALATAIYLEGVPISDCPHLSPDQLSQMEAKLAQGRAMGEGKKTPSHVKALESLREKLAHMDFKSMAQKAGARYLPGDREAVELPFLGMVHRVEADRITVQGSPAHSVWVEVFINIYLTRANGKPSRERWVAYRELPNSISKSKSFEEAADGIAKHFGDDLEGLCAACARFGGEVVDFGSADRAIGFTALPRVPVLLLYWKAEEDFPARSTMLLDGGVLDYLDQEAIVFLAEAMVKVLTGGALGEVVT